MAADIEKIKQMCKVVSEEIYILNKPTESYAKDIYHLLLGTCAQESLFKYRRQLGFKEDSLGGAFSLWQLEKTSIKEGLDLLKKYEDLRVRASRILSDFNAKVPHTSFQDVLKFLQTEEGDSLGCILCRLHYCRRPGKIPSTVEEQAAYWKQYYNTIYGSGKIDEYIDKWERMVEPKL